MTVYIDKALLDAAGLTDFPELYAYIRERDSQPPVGEASPVPIGEQTLQKQVKDNDDALAGPIDPVQPPTIEAMHYETFGFILLTPGLQLYDSSQSTFRFAVQGNKVTFNLGLKTATTFKGYIMGGFPYRLVPTKREKPSIIVGHDCDRGYHLQCFIDDQGPYISTWSDDAIPQNVHIALSGTYYIDYELYKRATTDVNNDGQNDIMDDWHQNSQVAERQTESWVYDVVKQQTDQIASGGAQPASKTISNYLNNNTKLRSPYQQFTDDRAAYFVKEGPQCTFNFRTRKITPAGNINVIFGTIDKQLKTPLDTWFPVHSTISGQFVSFELNQENKVIFNSNSGLSVDIDFAGTYIIAPQTDNDNSNGLPSAPEEPDSHIDKVIIDQDTILRGGIPPPISQYTIKNRFDDILLTVSYIDTIDRVNNQFYEIFDGVNKYVVFNVHLSIYSFNEKFIQIGSLPTDLLSDFPVYFPLTCLYEKEKYQTRPPAGYTAIGTETNKQRWYIYLSDPPVLSQMIHYYTSGSYYLPA
ncbi:MAG: hypothetical protein EZS28_002968 [Streblomastix strix]|uniref:Uncharacterized protein n=1 Tax=Streblomastix strix TaxID=222440 RepID=A0A5J4X2D2_9EUKA|nr:MAG: hypothetical protein EZS28_002968 [Streblomastix strix]